MPRGHILPCGEGAAASSNAVISECKVLPFAENERAGAPEGGLRNAKAASGPPQARTDAQSNDYLVDPASNHMLVSKIKPCMSKYMPK